MLLGKAASTPPPAWPAGPLAAVATRLGATAVMAAVGYGLYASGLVDDADVKVLLCCFSSPRFAVPPFCCD
jgi:hypothetical protein